MSQLPEAADINARALATMQTLENKRAVANCLNLQAAIHLSLGDEASARELFTQALAVSKALGYEPMTSTVLANLAELELHGVRSSRRYGSRTSPSRSYRVEKTNGAWGRPTATLLPIALRWAT
jgi:hypothetical protein